MQASIDRAAEQYMAMVQRTKLEGVQASAQESKTGDVQGDDSFGIPPTHPVSAWFRVACRAFVEAELNLRSPRGRVMADVAMVVEVGLTGEPRCPATPRSETGRTGATECTRGHGRLLSRCSSLVLKAQNWSPAPDRGATHIACCLQRPPLPLLLQHPLR